MRKFLHRVAPHARRIRALADVAGPALHVLLFLPRPRWANRLLLGASAIASVAGWVADAAAGQDGAWRELDLGPAADYVARAALEGASVTDRRGSTTWARTGDGVDLVIQPGQVFARAGEEGAALDSVVGAAWAAAGGILSLAATGDGLTVEPARGRAPGRAGAAGAVAAVAGALWPTWRQAGQPVTVALCGPRGSRLHALARHAAALRAVQAAGPLLPEETPAEQVDAAVRAARVLEVPAGLLTAHLGATRDAVRALRPALLVVDVGPLDPAAQATEAARAAAQATDGCAVALLCWTQIDGEQVPLGPCDRAIEVADVGADEAEGGASVADGLALDDDPAAATVAAATCAAEPRGPSLEAAVEAARARAEAVRAALCEVGPDAVRGMPAGFALEALLAVGDLRGEEAAEVIAEVRFRADSAIEDYSAGIPDPDGAPDEDDGDSDDGPPSGGTLH